MPPLKSVSRALSLAGATAASAGPFLLSTLLSALTACSDVESPKKNAADAGAVSPSPTGTSPVPGVDPPTFGAANDGGVPLSTGDSGALTGTCPAGKLCFDVSPMRPNAKPLAGRLIIMWAQLNREGPDPIAEIGYEAPFLGTETVIEIPIASVSPPTDPNLLCQRNCDDEAYCPCVNDPRVGVGYAVVVVDENKNGVADIGATELESEPFVGVGAVGIAYSTQSFKPAPAVPYGVSRTFATLFPQGIETGVAIHSLASGAGGTFDTMGPLAPTARHRLPVCDTTDQATCIPSWPVFP